METLKEFASKITSNLEVYFGLHQEEIDYTVDVVGGEFKIRIFLVNSKGQSDIELCRILFDLTPELKFIATDTRFQLLPNEEQALDFTLEEVETYIYDILETDRIKFIIENLR